MYVCILNCYCTLSHTATPKGNNFVFTACSIKKWFRNNGKMGKREKEKEEKIKKRYSAFGGIIRTKVLNISFIPSLYLAEVSINGTPPSFLASSSTANY